MLDGHIIRTDADLFAVHFPNRAERLAAELRQNFTPRESKQFGIEQAYEHEGATADGLQAVVGVIAAVLATFALYASVAFLATVGLGEGSYSATVVTTTLA